MESGSKIVISNQLSLKLHILLGTCKPKCEVKHTIHSITIIVLCLQNKYIREVGLRFKQYKQLCHFCNDYCFCRHVTGI